MEAYQGFTSREELVRDHKGLKEQIKDREKQLDCLQELEDLEEIKAAVDEIANQMMAVNM
jgi:flagellar hook-associated protein FlgK